MEKNCPNCNRPNPSDAVFCRHCASPLTPGVGGQQQQVNQQWNQPPQGGQMGANFAQQSAGASGRAVASVALAAGGLCCGLLTGIPGAILGWMEINAIKEGRSSPKGMLMAQIGLWGGIIISILSLIFSVLYMLMAMMGGGGGYRY